jgi:MFS family permease
MDGEREAAGAASAADVTPALAQTAAALSSTSPVHARRESPRRFRLDGLKTPWPWSWNVLGVSLVFQTITFGVIISSFTFFVEHWMREFGVARSEIMLAATIGAFMPAFLGPVAGRAMDMLPARRVIACGLVALAAAYVMLSQVTAVWQIVFVYALVTPIAGAFSGATPAQVLAARWFPARRGFAIGLASMGLTLGGVLLPPAVVYLIGEVGWRATYGVFALATVAIVLPLVLLVVRSGPDGENPKTFRDSRAAEASGTAHTIRSILLERNFWVLFVFMFPMGTALSVIQFNLAGFAAERGLSVTQAGGLVSIMFFAVLMSKFAWGYLADRVAHRLLLCVAALLDVAACFALSLAGGFYAVCGSLMLVGLASGCMLPLTGAALSHQFGPAFGRAFGLATMSLPLTLVGPPVAARLQEQWGSYGPVMMAMAGFVGLSLLAALFLQKKAQAFEGSGAASMSSTPSAAR